ncbi:phasin family protein [Polynucleobacter sp. AP-Nino-20-G2]|uniref:phasin family protein n=1 Tax=Polynucleobacter sp. AP-Nino-20-G2 TaxID=2576917 RepID=UPI001BFDFF7F|nr:phasin family protein [Polynucleobacter sp. AP-Nino-20-G2]QWE17024.1 phasin family protein [Polynucleobacter sp. AP-Nino-20-G2]
MSKNPFDLNAMANQAKGMEAVKAVGQVALTSAQAIAQLNQQASQELAKNLQTKVAELMKTQDPKAAFDYVHAEVLQDAAKEVADYQAKLFQALASGNKELAKIAESMIKESQHDLIHFVNEATQNAPAGTEPYTSVFKASFSNALQNFELIRAAMADSFVNFEKSVENMSSLSGAQKGASSPPKKSTKK